MAIKQEQEPASDTVEEVAPGILRLQLPIDFSGLGHVNCYAIPDERGLTLVDLGLPGDDTWAAIGERLKAGGLELEAVHTVVVTHSHPDHFGSAGRMVEETGADLVTHESFELAWHRRDITEMEQEEYPWGGTREFPSEMRRRWQEQSDAGGHHWLPPVPSKPLSDQGEIVIGDRRFVGVHTPGHTRDHLCLHDPENKVLLSGDHVLPTITPHISGMFGDADPLTDFFRSLEKVALLPVSMVLPAHGHPFTDLKARTREIHDHHLERLDRLMGAGKAHGDATVDELSHELFAERHWGFMAQSETFAHLEHLRLLGLAEAHRGPDGLLRYRVA